MRTIRAVILAVVFLGFVGTPTTYSLRVQDSQDDAGQFPPFPGESPRRRDRTREEMERRMEKERNKERQAALKRDTDKLLDLATQLKQYVDKTNENVMSVEVIKKAEEIEKLAKSVKDKMKAQ